MEAYYYYASGEEPVIMDCCTGSEEVCDNTVCEDGRQYMMMRGRLIVITVTVLIVVIILVVITALIVGICCWCYHRKKRRGDIRVILGEGGHIVLGDTNENGRTTLNVYMSQLEARRHSETNNYLKDDQNSKMKSLTGEISDNDHLEPNAKSSIPLTEDGYATLESGDHTVIVVNHPKITIPESLKNNSQGYKNEATGSDHDYDEPYWEPANQEEELLSQLSNLGLPVISTESIELKECLGNGEFGTVQRGLWTMGEGDHTMEVAIKSMEQGACKEDRVKFLQEAAIMGQFTHRNILRILGIILDNSIKIIVEIMPKGDLLHCLISLRSEERRNENEELRAFLLSYSRQIAHGMGYLSSKKFVHRDLAARNVLISDEDICKIADFGLSRNLQHEDYYTSHGGKIPVKWTAPEALHYRKYSTASDIWSYGCLLYEIWSLGYKPFQDTSNAQVIEKVTSGYRLPPPPGCPRSIYQVMIECWNPTPTLRPQFSEILVTLQQPDFRILKWVQGDFQYASEKARILGSPIEEGFHLYEDLQQAYAAAETNIKRPIK